MYKLSKKKKKENDFIFFQIIFWGKISLYCILWRCRSSIVLKLTTFDFILFFIFNLIISIDIISILILYSLVLVILKVQAYVLFDVGNKDDAGLPLVVSGVVNSGLEFNAFLSYGLVASLCWFRASLLKDKLFFELFISDGI